MIVKERRFCKVVEHWIERKVMFILEVMFVSVLTTYLFISFLLVAIGFITLRGKETFWESVEFSFGWPIWLFLIIRDVFLGR
jgi:hypothetical protein